MASIAVTQVNWAYDKTQTQQALSVPKFIVSSTGRYVNPANVKGFQAQTVTGVSAINSIIEFNEGAQAPENVIYVKETPAQLTSLGL